MFNPRARSMVRMNLLCCSSIEFGIVRYERTYPIVTVEHCCPIVFIESNHSSSKSKMANIMESSRSLLLSLSITSICKPSFKIRIDIITRFRQFPNQFHCMNILCTQKSCKGLHRTTLRISRSAPPTASFGGSVPIVK